MASGNNILIIDDDEVLQRLLSEHLRDAGYQPFTASDGLSGLKALYDHHPDLIILDVMMPSMDGWTVASRIREISRVPLIMLTAKDSEEDRLHGFSLGVDDFVGKPFSFAEMVARVGAVIARTYGPRPEQDHVISSDDVAVDLTARRVTRKGEVVELTPTEFRLLALLARHAGRPLSHDYLLAEIWGPGYEGQTEHVKRYMWMLRQKLEANPTQPRHLLTERGYGYRFE